MSGISTDKESITPSSPAYMFPCMLQIGEYDQILFFDTEAFTFNAVEQHLNAVITSFSLNTASVYVDWVCVQILCPQTKLKDTLSCMFPLVQTSVSLGNVGNLRAMTSPLNLKNEQGPSRLCVCYTQASWIGFQGLLMAVGVDGEPWSWEVGGR